MRSLTGTLAYRLRTGAYRDVVGGIGTPGERERYRNYTSSPDVPVIHVAGKGVPVPCTDTERGWR